MGLISAAAGALGSGLRDQWKEFYSCDALPSDVIAVRAVRKTRGFGNHGNANVISDGSLIAVADGQCMIITEQGQVADICAEPGEYRYDSSLAPSLFAGSFTDSLGSVLSDIAARFTFGGQAPADQRVYFINTKELTGSKYGTPNPIPFRVTDPRAGIDIDIGLRCFGEYSFRISDPVQFYTNNAGNFADTFTADMITPQMRTELLTALQPAFARISAEGIRYSQIPAHTGELAEALRTELSEIWNRRRGIEMVSIGVSSVTAEPEDEAMLREMQRNAAYLNPQMAAAALAGAQADAMKAAAANPAGAVSGFMGLNMAGSGISLQNLYAQGTQTAAEQPWTCPGCGRSNTGRFCPDCGREKPQDRWFCPQCGTENTGRFCPQCGTKKPE